MHITQVKNFVSSLYFERISYFIEFFMHAIRKRRYKLNATSELFMMDRKKDFICIVILHFLIVILINKLHKFRFRYEETNVFIPIVLS